MSTNVSHTSSKTFNFTADEGTANKSLRSSLRLNNGQFCKTTDGGLNPSKIRDSLEPNEIVCPTEATDVKPNKKRKVQEMSGFKEDGSDEEEVFMIDTCTRNQPAAKARGRGRPAGKIRRLSSPIKVP